MPDLGNTAVISPTDASNNTGTMPSWLGSAAPSTLDDAGRALQGAIAREWENRSFAITSTGSANAYVVTYTVAPAAYRSGQVYSFIANFSVTGSATANINSLGAKTIKKIVTGSKTNLASGDIVSGAFVMLAYDGTDLVVLVGLDMSSYQPLDSDLTTIASLTATTDNFIQSKSSAWASRTPTQVTADLIAVVGDSGSGGTKGLVPAPSSGDAAANKFLRASGTWISPIPTVIKKASTQSVASATLTNDSDFTFALAASTKYRISIVAIINHGNASDFQCDVTGPASPTAVSIIGSATLGGQIVNGNATAFSSAMSFLIGSGSFEQFTAHIYISNGVNAGTFQFRWANVAGTTSNAMDAQSFMTYQVVS